MGEKSGIQWTDSTWNPIVGCTRIAEGCRNCYAERLAATRLAHTKKYAGIARMVDGEPRWTGEVRLYEPHLQLPIKWREPQRIFVNSQSDLFHESLPFEAIDKVFLVMELARQHTFQVLTKRPARMMAYMLDRYEMPRENEVGHDPNRLHAPPDNVWLGTSAGLQAEVDYAVPFLVNTPAAVRFLSYEPALGKISIRQWLYRRETAEKFPKEAKQRLHWVIIGGESGPGARAFNIDWADDVVRQCREGGVAPFVKQLGAFPITDNANRWDFADHVQQFEMADPKRSALGAAHYKLSNKKGGDWDEWPEELRVREFPGAAKAVAA